jgi:hypothetical protein
VDINPDTPSNIPNNCYYRSFLPNPTTPFTEMWSYAMPNSASAAYQFLFKYPDMNYSGVEFIPELGVFGDVGLRNRT